MILEETNILYGKRSFSGEKKLASLYPSLSLSLSLASFSGIYTSLPALIEIQGLEWEERER